MLSIRQHSTIYGCPIQRHLPANKKKVNIDLINVLIKLVALNQSHTVAFRKLVLHLSDACAA